MKEEHFLLKESIPSLLWVYVRPAMFASLITGLYGIIDGIFIGQKMGPSGIAAITLAFPITTFLIGLGVLVSVGTSIAVSRNMAAGKEDMANTYIRKGLLMFFIMALLTTLAGFFTPEVMTLLGKGSDNYVVALAQSFVSILLFGSFIYMAPIFLSDLLKNLGKPKEAMLAMIAGTLTTIVLDYIFIFLLELEMAGAALATIMGQLMAAFILLLLMRRQPIARVQPNRIRERYRSFLTILKGGLTSFIIQLSTMALLLVHNRLFLLYGNELYVSSFGIIGYALTAFWLLVNGFVGGTQPIVSYNHALNHRARVDNTLRLTFILVTGFSIAYALLFYIFPNQIIGIFSSHDVQLLNLTRKGFFLVMYALPFAGINIQVAMYFQAIGKTKTSAFLSLGRVVFFMIPLLLILPKLFSVNGIYLIVPLSEFFTAILSVAFLRHHQKENKKYIELRSRNDHTDTQRS